jgi:hypothetical protein
MKRPLPVLLLVLTAAGCAHSQQPVTTYAIDYSATAPTIGCSTAQPCVLTFSDAPQTGGACTAPLPIIACSTAAGGSACVHSNVTTGVTYCATAQAVSSTGVTGQAAPVFTVVVPPLPGQPTTPSGAIAVSPVAMVEHAPSNEQLAINKDGSLRVTHTLHIKANIGSL